METFSTLLAFCVGNSPVTCEFLAQRPVMQSFEVFFWYAPFSKQSWGGDLRRHHAHYGIIVMETIPWRTRICLPTKLIPWILITWSCKEPRASAAMYINSVFWEYSTLSTKKFNVVQQVLYKGTAVAVLYYTRLHCNGSKIHQNNANDRVNTLRLGQNGCHFADNILKLILLNENVLISIKIPLKFVPRGPIKNIPALLQVRLGDVQVTSQYLNQWWSSLVMHLCITSFNQLIRNHLCCVWNVAFAWWLNMQVSG